MSHPACESNVRDACVKPGATGAKAETRKWNDHGRGINGSYSFVPFAVETYGRLGRDAEKLLKDMAELAASTGDCDRDAFMHWMRKEISVSLIRGNARVFRRYLGQLIRGTGTNFQQGDDAPTLGD